jgi:hypothetical protein
LSSYNEGSDGLRDAPLSRDPSGETTTYAPPQPYQQQQQRIQQPMPGPYGGYGHWEMRPRRVYPVETKPFFLTSEFAAAVLAIAGIAITAAASDAFGAWRAWILVAGITAAYLISRGIAKSGTRSHADDFREHLDLDFGRRGNREG